VSNSGDDNTHNSNYPMTFSLHQYRTACLTDNPILLRGPDATAKGTLYWMTSDITSRQHVGSVGWLGGFRIMNNHDSAKFCIKDLLNSCGVKTRVEVAECFRAAEPDNNQRPDIMLYSNAPDSLHQQATLTILRIKNERI
jgi:hypothetical protein